MACSRMIGTPNAEVASSWCHGGCKRPLVYKRSMHMHTVVDVAVHGRRLSFRSLLFHHCFASCTTCMCGVLNDGLVLAVPACQYITTYYVVPTYLAANLSPIPERPTDPPPTSSKPPGPDRSGDPARPDRPTHLLSRLSLN